MKRTMLAAVAALIVLPLALTGRASAETKKPADLRLEVNGGANWGDPHLSFNGLEDDLNVGTGYSVGAQLWLDRVGFDYLSLGAQYLYLRQGNFSQSGAVNAPGITGNGTVEIKPSLHTFFVNAALRYPEGRINPYLGGGIGMAISRASVSASGTVTVNGQTFTGSGTDSDSSANFAGQVFGGVDVMVTDTVYLGVSGRYILTDASLFGVDVDSRVFSAMATLGYRF
jgi:opacity protein-like surface antigen